MTLYLLSTDNKMKSISVNLSKIASFKPTIIGHVLKYVIIQKKNFVAIPCFALGAQITPSPNFILF